MLASDIILMFRTLMAEPFQARWIDQPGVANSTLLLASQARREVARETRWLNGTLQATTLAGVQEYTLPDTFVGLRRVYIAGPGFAQRITRTSIPLMEGDQLGVFDQSGTNFTPQWLTLPTETFPVSNAERGFGFTGGLMFPGRRPQYYLRGEAGGRIGLVPAPSSAYTINIDSILMPAEMTSLQNVSPFPIDWKEAIAWYMCALAYYSDQSVGADSMEAIARQRYAESLGKLLDWKENFDEGANNGPQILTYRTFYPGTHGHSGEGWGDW